MCLFFVEVKGLKAMDAVAVRADGVRCGSSARARTLASGPVHWLVKAVFEMVVEGSRSTASRVYTDLVFEFEFLKQRYG